MPQMKNPFISITSRLSGEEYGLRNVLTLLYYSFQAFDASLEASCISEILKR